MPKQYKFSQVYSDFQPKIHIYLSKMLDEHSAEDACQIAFEKINRGLASFKGESKLSTWVYKIATNTALDILKSSAHKQSKNLILVQFPEETVPDTNHSNMLQIKSTSPDQQIIKDEMNACIREFVDRLPPNYKIIITLNELHGFTNGEIAEILEISLAAAKIRLHRARAKLKKELEAGCDFYHTDQNSLACDRKQPASE